MKIKFKGNLRIRTVCIKTELQMNSKHSKMSSELTLNGTWGLNKH